ncbi:peptidylprolyl isomerase [Orrella sp. NBD-18]|uniref:Periplasmic chaperone PpiD n=1 Tax=Sheuella amnicola TaxID=2707330 RepID=A0A6B2QWF6_9BURK|nr:SurA N-terminal domain-containing protein [Sheuella amnicola]NDY81978.1 peptidylprolyl isomerase [Sheuella amnicola]HBI83475.1 peptidylprolyl isomerase [Alcaligenaceae bacterium]
MFDFIRNHSRWMQLILLLLILPSFVFFGVQSYTSFMASEPELASVDGQAITLGEFNQARRYELERYRSMLGGQFDAAAFDTPQFREQLLNQLIDQRVISTAATKGQYSVSDETLRRTIASIQSLQVNGQFSTERYRQVLAGQGTTPAAFEAGMRRDLALAQVLQPIGLTASVPAEIPQKLIALLTEQRTISRLEFKSSAYENSIKVDDNQIKSWYDANQAKLQIPENLDVQYIVLNEAAATRDIKISEDDIGTYYKQNLSRYGQPERRKVRHILIEVPAGADEAAKTEARKKAEDLAKRASADPKTFPALAKEFSQDPGSASEGGDLGWIGKNMLVPQVEDAVFTLSKGVVSGVVESPFGLHVILIDDIQAATPKQLSEVREDIVSEITKQIAADRFATMANKLTKLIYDQRDSLKPISDELGLPLHQVDGLSRDGLLHTEQRQPGSPAYTDLDRTVLGNPKVRLTAFSTEVLKDKFNSGAIELSPDTIVALRVTKVNPASTPPLAQVKDFIRKILVNEGATKAAREAGAKKLDELKSSAKPDTKGFEPEQVVTRQNPQKLTQVQLEAVMKLKNENLPVFVGVDDESGFAILEMTKVEPGPAPEKGQIDQLKSQLSQAWGAAEEQAALKILRAQYKVKLLPDASRLIKGELDEAKL